MQIFNFFFADDSYIKMHTRFVDDDLTTAKFIDDKTLTILPFTRNSGGHPYTHKEYIQTFGRQRIRYSIEDGR